MNQYGIQVYKPDTQPVNVLGDAVVHMMRFTDPVVKSYYDNFEKSLTPAQKRSCSDSITTTSPTMARSAPYDQWYKDSGLTQLFGGYAFGGNKKWPNSYYTPEQLQMFDQMMQYLKTEKPQP